MNPQKGQWQSLFATKTRRKRNRPDFTTERGIARRLQEGRGSGEGSNYKPWFVIREFSSKGYRIATWSHKFGRVVHLFSMLEWWIFLMLEADPTIISLKEQFPLSRKQTRAIARLLKIRHPKVDKVDVVMTTDFVVVRRTPTGDRTEAIFVKWRKDLRRRRVVQKLEIERTYHRAEETHFVAMNETNVPRALVNNLDFVRQMMRPGSMFDISTETIAAADKIMRPTVGTKNWAAMCSECDATLCLKPGTSARIARYQIATREWPVDLTHPISASKPLHLIPNETPSEKVA